MYCKSCLAANPDGAVKCVQCGAELADAIPAPNANAGPPPPPAPKDEFELQAGEEKVAGQVAPPPPPPGAPIGGPPPKEKKEDPKPPADAPPMPPDYKTPSIVFMAFSGLSIPVCCCFCWGFPAFFGFIFGVLAFLESGKVKTLYDQNDFAGAESASKKTRLYIMLGIGAIVLLSFMSFGIRFLLSGLGFLTGIMNSFNR